MKPISEQLLSEVLLPSSCKWSKVVHHTAKIRHPQCWFNIAIILAHHNRNLLIRAGHGHPQNETFCQNGCVCTNMCTPNANRHKHCTKCGAEFAIYNVKFTKNKCSRLRWKVANKSTGFIPSDSPASRAVQLAIGVRAPREQWAIAGSERAIGRQVWIACKGEPSCLWIVPYRMAPSWAHQGGNSNLVLTPIKTHTTGQTNCRCCQ